MSLPLYPNSDPDIVPPGAQSRLEGLNARHDVEAARLARLEGLAILMDAQFNIPFSPIPIGLDTLVGLIPGIGDTISMGVSGFIVAGAGRLDVPKSKLGVMCGNMLIDWAIGLVPIIGDLFDIGWRGNMRNVRIAREHIEARWDAERAAALQD
jgi:hypothetical protein